MMEKKIISVEVYSFSPSHFEGTLKEVLEIVKNEIKEYGPDAKLDYNEHFYYDYDPNPSPRYSVMIEREETDEEFEKRKKVEEKWNVEQLERDRAMLAALKKKLGEE